MKIHIINPTLTFPMGGICIRNADTHEEYNLLYSIISVAYHSENTIYIYSRMGLHLHLLIEDIHSYTLLKRKLNTKPYYRPSEQTSAPGPASIY
jgi:hypothetical protein